MKTNLILYQKDFLDCCTGVKGMKMLYDGIFKEIFNPGSTPERLETLLSLIIGRKVRVKDVLPNDSVRLGAESSLIRTDIMELAEMDRNTVLFMIDRMQAELEEQGAELKEKDAKLKEQERLIRELQAKLDGEQKTTT